MRIGINALLLKRQKTGTISYIYNLIKSLNKIDTKNEYVLFTNQQFQENDFSLQGNFLTKKVGLREENTYKRIYWEQFYLSRELIHLKIDLLHSPSQVALRSSATRSILTIHELTYLIHPEFLSKHKYLYYRYFVPISIYKTDKIIAVSENLKKDILRFFRVPQDKIEVICCGVDEIYRPVEKNIAKNEVRQRFGIYDDYILYVGTIEPKKNLKRLIEAYFFLRKDTNRYKLVIAGPKGWLYNEIYKTIKRLNIDNDIIFTGHLYSSDLLFLYNAASVFVYPSLYEGFGLPVVEAMACKTPVVTSNTPALREVAEEAAIFVDPLDTKSLSKSITEVLENPSLQENLIARGLKRARQFSWEEAAQRTLKLYMQVCNNQ